MIMKIHQFSHLSIHSQLRSYIGEHVMYMQWGCIFSKDIVYTGSEATIHV